YDAPWAVCTEEGQQAIYVDKYEWLSWPKTIEEVVNCVTHLVWETIGRYIPIKMQTVQLNIVPPVELHPRDESDYAAWKESAK
ncbi:MAG TPA: hypothetical protein VGK87_12125, partial [Anaerolineae bacterium]